MRYILAILFVVGLTPVGRTAEPLHQQIDRLLAARLKREPATQSSDAEFFRRINLDLAGKIPAAEEVRKFLADKNADKRTETIDRLLNDPSYARNMANLFHVMLMERRGDDAEWIKFLENSFAENVSWDRMVAAILKPNAEDEQNRGAAFFYTQRLKKVGQQVTDFPGLTRDVGRMFLGVDLQCAECHDHLFIDDYKQVEFQGLFAVYKNVSIRTGKFPAINEKSMVGKLEFVSVFDPSNQSVGPRIPFGKEFEIPPPQKKDPKAKKPSPNDPPEFSALQLISDALPSKENPFFRRNIANRLWFLTMGTGLVEPLDQFHSANPPTHPQLLDLLATQFADHKFDIKWMLKELMLTEAYQRSSRGTQSSSSRSETSDYAIGKLRRLTADQLFLSTLEATGNLARLTFDKEPPEEFKELKTNFVKAFSSEPKEPPLKYSPAVKQALYLLNDSGFLGLLKEQDGNLISRLSSLNDTEAVDELYVSVFSRFPTDQERGFLVQYLNENRANRKAVLARVAWAMISSIEFAINH